MHPSQIWTPGSAIFAKLLRKDKEVKIHTFMVNSTLLWELIPHRVLWGRMINSHSWMHNLHNYCAPGPDPFMNIIFDSKHSFPLFRSTRVVRTLDPTEEPWRVLARPLSIIHYPLCTCSAAIHPCTRPLADCQDGDQSSVFCFQTLLSPSWNLGWRISRIVLPSLRLFLCQS